MSRGPASIATDITRWRIQTACLALRRADWPCVLTRRVEILPAERHRLWMQSAIPLRPRAPLYGARVRQKQKGVEPIGRLKNVRGAYAHVHRLGDGSAHKNP